MLDIVLPYRIRLQQSLCTDGSHLQSHLKIIACDSRGKHGLPGCNAPSQEITQNIKCNSRGKGRHCKVFCSVPSTSPLIRTMFAVANISRNQLIIFSKGQLNRCQLAFWLWDTHNAVNVRLLHERADREDENFVNRRKKACNGHHARSVLLVGGRIIHGTKNSCTNSFECPIGM